MSVVPSLFEYYDFDPRSIGGCVLWLDGRDSNTMFKDTNGTDPVVANGDDVKCWKDKSVQSNNATTNATLVPQYFRAAVTGVPFGVNFTFDQGAYLDLCATKLPTGTTPVSGFIAFSTFRMIGATISNQTLLRWGNGASGRDVQYLVIQTVDGGNVTPAVNLFTTGQITDSTDVAGGGFIHILSSTISSINSGWRNGNAFSGGTAAVTLNTGTASAYLGTQSPNTLFFRGAISEVLVYNTALTTAERQTIEGYLARKWGRSSALPTLHPFRNIPVVSRLFQPLDIDGCLLWLDSQDNSRITLSSGNVTSWADKSGNGLNFAGNSNPRLATISNSQYIDTATNGTSFLSRAFALPITYSMGLVGYSTIATGFVGMLYSSPDARFMLRANDNQISPWKGNGVTWGTPTGTFPPITSNSVWSLTNATAAGPLLFYRNGNYQASNSGVSNVETTDVFIGTWGTTGTQNSWRGYFGDVVIYSNALTSNQREQLEGYLAWKFNLVSQLSATHSFKLAPPLSPLFNPHMTPSNCAVWFDAADTSTITGTTQVTVWSNKGTLGGTASNRTSSCTSGNTVNGLNFVRCPSGADLGIVLSLATQARSWFFVTRLNEPMTGSSQYFAVLNSLSNNGELGVQWQSAGNYRPYIGTAVSIRVSAVIPNTLFDNVVHMGSLVNGTATTFNRVTMNGSRQVLQSNATATGYSSANTTYVLGRASFARSVDIMEVIFYYGALADAQRQRVEGYLAWKWGLQDKLPTNHAYYRFRP